MVRLLSIPLVILALLAGALWWSGGGGSEKPPEFTFINRGEVGTLDLNRMSWMQDIRLGYALWEGLYTLDPKTLEAIPGCADPIDISTDGTVYTFHIRPQAKWSNGDDLKAQDFQFGWRRMLEEPGDYTYLLHYIKGAEAYERDLLALAEAKGLPAKDAPAAIPPRPSPPAKPNATSEEWEAYTKDVKKFFHASLVKMGDTRETFNALRPKFEDVAVKAINDKTLEVTLKHRLTCFKDICAFPPAFPQHQKSMEPFAELDEKTGLVSYKKEFTRPPTLVGNGPYKAVSWQFKRRLRMEANPYYWDVASLQCKVIEQVNADDPMWAFSMYDSGGVDWMAEVTGEIAAELREKKRGDLRVFPAFGTYFYSFNCRKKLNDGSPNPFGDVRVRKAFSMALDRKVIVDTITRMGEIPSKTYIPAGAFLNYKSPDGLPEDVEKARALLAEAGYPNGQGFPSMSLLFNNEGQHGPIAQNVRRQWKDKLGVDLRLEGIEIKQFRERLHNKDYAVCRASWYGDYNDPSTFTDKYKPDSGNNDSDWINKTYADLCAKADVEADAAQRLRYYEQAETLLLDEAPILPMYTYVSTYLFRDNVTGIPLNPRGMIMFKSVKVQR